MGKILDVISTFLAYLITFIIGFGAGALCAILVIA